MDYDELLQSLAEFAATFDPNDEDEIFQEMGNKHVEKPCIYKGERYPTLTAAAKAHGVSIGAVSQYVKREGCLRREYPIVHKGISYKSIKECATITGENRSTISSWVQRHNG